MGAREDSPTAHDRLFLIAPRAVYWNVCARAGGCPALKRSIVEKMWDPKAEEWFGQNYARALKNNDFVVIPVSPENYKAVNTVTWISMSLESHTEEYLSVLNYNYQLILIMATSSN